MSNTKPELAILVFAKAPLPGSAKTRLIPQLGADGAAALQGLLLKRALVTARVAAPAALELWCAPDTEHPALQAAAHHCHATLRAQQGADLGSRMAHAFACTLQRFAAVVVIGTDCPALTAQHLRQAAAALHAGSDAVLVPAEDGGYTLIGLARDEPRLFSGIAWGSTQVMAQTRERLRACGMAWQELETLWDVDRPEDWRRLQQSGLLDDAHAPF